MISNTAVWTSPVTFIFFSPSTPSFNLRPNFLRPFLMHKIARYLLIRGNPATHPLFTAFPGHFNYSRVPGCLSRGWDWKKGKWIKFNDYPFKGVLTPGFMSLSRSSNSRISRLSGYAKTLILHGLYLSFEPSTASCPVQDTHFIVSTKFMLYEAGHRYI